MLLICLIRIAMHFKVCFIVLHITTLFLKTGLAQSQIGINDKEKA